MNLSRLFLSAFGVLCVLNVTKIVGSALPFGVGVFPFLTSGWYYKPNPVENVIFGLLVVKVLAIRLAAITGILPIPYHLNDIFARSLGKRSVSEFFSANLTTPRSINKKKGDYSFGSKPNFRANNNTTISSTELKAMYRLLLGVRRLDTNDCFLKTLCFLGHETNKSKSISLGDHEIIETINYLTSVEEVMRKSQDPFNKPSIMDVFQNALAFGSKSNSSSSCDRMYVMCTLTKTEMNFESIISDLP